MADATFEKKLQRYRELRVEQDGLASKLAEAGAAVERCRTAALAATAAAVVEGGQAAARAATVAGEALAAALDTRDRLEERGEALALGIGALSRDLTAGAKDLDDKARAEVAAQAQARLTAAAPAVLAALIDAGILWKTTGAPAPLEVDRLPEALLTYTGITPAAVREGTFLALDRSKAAATAARAAILAEVSNG